MITFGILALNEEEQIGTVIENVIKTSQQYPDVDFEIIPVDDGSTDNTYAIMLDYAKRFDFVKPVKHNKNKGIGASAVTIINNASHPKVCFLNGDNNVGFSMYQSSFKYCSEDLLVCYYFVNTEVRSKFRILLSQAYNQLCMVLFNIHLRYINGGAIYSTELLRKFDIKSSGAAFLIEITAKTLLSGVKFFEVPCFFSSEHDKSVSLKFKNIIKTLYDLILVYLDIKFINKDKYSLTPERVLRF